MSPRRWYVAAPAPGRTLCFAGHVLAVTFVTIGEMTKWTLVPHWGPTRRQDLPRHLDAYVTLPYDSQVAARWGEIQAAGQLCGRPRPVNDSWIAACCLARNLPLITTTAKTSKTSPTMRGLVLPTL